MKSGVIVQVHKPTKCEISAYGDLRIECSEESSDSNKTYVKDENGSIQNIQSKETTTDSEIQNNSKIIKDIEGEISRDRKHTTFSDSRPQSLSFYEEEKIPEELSGNLELLSPEERKHYKRRKDHRQTITDDRNVYNNIQDTFKDNNETIIATSLKKSKSRKKKHVGETNLGIGTSREMIIPKEKYKTRKKKHETSPKTSKRKHRKTEDESNNIILMAIEDLQDDVFKNENEEKNERPDTFRKGPGTSDKVYVQKTNKFEIMTRKVYMENHPIKQQYDQSTIFAITSAIHIQQTWRKFTTFCHGILGGLGLAQFIYITNNEFTVNTHFFNDYGINSEVYILLFYVLCTLCLLSVFDRYDIAQCDGDYLRKLVSNKKGSLVIALYIITLILHLITTSKDDKIFMLAHKNEFNISSSDIQVWNSFSLSRAIFSFMAWLFLSFIPQEDCLLEHLHTMEKYTHSMNAVNP